MSITVVDAQRPKPAGELTTDLAWLTAGDPVEPLAIVVPGEFSQPERDFARLAVTQRRLLWSCHYSIDRFTPTLWALRRRDALPALVVCPPASLAEWAGAWTDTLRSTLPSGAGVTIAAYGSAKWRRGVDVAVITYGKLRRMSVEDMGGLARGTKGVVLDESHKAREETTLIHTAVMALAAGVQRDAPVFALSTQPVANRLRELCLQLRLLGMDEGPLSDPVRLAQLLSARPDLVARKLAEMGLVLHHEVAAVEGYMPRLDRRLVPVAITPQSKVRVRGLQHAFEQFLTTGRLGAAMSVTTPTPAAPDDRALIVRTGAELSAMLAAAPPLDGFLKLRAVILLDEIRTEIGQGKVDAALPFVRERITEGPTLVLVEHRALGQRMAAALKVPFLNGSVSQGARRRLCEAFQDGDWPALVLSMNLESVPALTRASAVVVMELPWNQALIDRALRCVYRAGVGHDIAMHVLTDDEHGLEGFLRHLHAYKWIVSEAILKGIDASDQELVTTLRTALAIETAGLHPDEWFQDHTGRVSAPIPARLIPLRRSLEVPAKATKRGAPKWRLTAPGWGEKPRPCCRCGALLVQGWVIDIQAKTVACDACQNMTE